MDKAHLVLFLVTTLTELSWQGVAARVAGHSLLSRRMFPLVIHIGRTERNEL